MPDNRVVEGRMVTPKTLAELVEDDEVMDTDAIEDADFDCPDCEGNVLRVVYMPSVLETVEGYKCQECAWRRADRT